MSRDTPFRCPEPTHCRGRPQHNACTWPFRLWVLTGMLHLLDLAATLRTVRSGRPRLRKPGRGRPGGEFTRTATGASYVRPSDKGRSASRLLPIAALPPQWRRMTRTAVVCCHAGGAGVVLDRPIALFVARPPQVCTAERGSDGAGPRAAAPQALGNAGSPAMRRGGGCRQPSE
jgi:hypothetical protein